MATTQDKQFFNLHVSGIGYLNRVRWVEPGKKSSGRRSEPFLACSISALRGDSDDVSYTYFDVRVSGEEAIEIVESLRKAVDEKRKVIISFRIGDIYPHMYERDVRDQNRKPTGQKEMAVLTKGRLLLINSVNVDGEKVYTREKAPVPPTSQVDEVREFWDSGYGGEEAPVREEGCDARPESGPCDAPAASRPVPPQAAGTSTRRPNFQPARNNERAEAMA